MPKMAEVGFMRIALAFFAFEFLLREGQAGLAIVEPYPQNIYPVEGTDAQVTCIAYDNEEKIKPHHIEFKRRDDYDQYYNITDPRVTYKSQFELDGKKLSKTMYIKNVQEADDDEKGGKYECWVFEEDKNFHTEAHGFSVTVILKKDIPEVKVTENVVANPKDKVVLTCNVTHQDKASDKNAVLKAISWTKDGELLEKVRNPNPGDPDAMLDPFSIDSIKPTDGGTYTCTLFVIMKATTQVNITGNVTVSVRASFDGDIANQELKYRKGEEVKFECRAIGFPLHVEWKRQRKNEEELRCINDTEDRYSITRKDRDSFYVLNIKDVTYEDRGKYFCCLPTNCSDSSEGCQEWTLRVKDPLGALWPFIGIVVEAILLFLIIFIAGKVKDRKERAQKDDRVEFSYSSTDEGDRGNVRLRKMDPVNA